VGFSIYWFQSPEVSQHLSFLHVNLQKSSGWTIISGGLESFWVALHGTTQKHHLHWLAWTCKQTHQPYVLTTENQNRRCLWVSLGYSLLFHLEARLHHRPQNQCHSRIGKCGSLAPDWMRELRHQDLQTKCQGCLYFICYTVWRHGMTEIGSFINLNPLFCLG
jgi:hypothetical protein